MNFLVNTSPLAGREGKFVTSRQIRERLEQRTAIATSRCASRTPATPTCSRCPGRGELHLTILLENMRREGYELAVSRPRVVIKEIDGEKQEPYELLTVDVEDSHQGGVMEELGRRKGDLQDMESDGTRPRAPRIPDSGARPDRLPGRVPDADARHRPRQPHVRRLRSGRRAAWPSAATAC